MKKEYPEIIFIEWYVGIAESEGEDIKVFWSHIPDCIYSVLVRKPSPLILHWQEETLRDLYSTFDRSFKEFSKNVTELLSDYFKLKGEKTVVIFGNKNVISVTKKCICGNDLFPSYAFVQGTYDIHSHLPGFQYSVNQVLEPFRGMMFQKIDTSLLREAV